MRTRLQGSPHYSHQVDGPSFSHSANASYSELSEAPVQTDSRGYIRYSQYVGENEYVLLDIVRGRGEGKSDSERHSTAIGFVRAGPRAKAISNTKRAAIVASGSLCPGQNQVIAELFNCLYYNYGIETVFGINGGFYGFYSKDAQPWVTLSPQQVSIAASQGGSMLGIRKGGFDAEKILNSCEMYGVNHLFIIGGDGSHSSAYDLNKAAKQRKLPMTIGCIPNSLENDLGIIDCSFGFETALEVAVKAVGSVTIESSASPNGVGILLLTGEHAGHLASHVALATGTVDLCLIPEAPFKLYGKDGILAYIQKVIERKGHAVIVAAEGVGSEVLSGRYQTKEPLKSNIAVEDSEQIRYKIGPFLQAQIDKYLKQNGIKPSFKYVEPSNMVRCVRASAADNVHCLSIAHNAVHAAMAGFTGFSSAIVNNRSVLLPVELILQSSPSRLSLKGRTWERVLSQTQQPSYEDYDEETIHQLETLKVNTNAKL